MCVCVCVFVCMCVREYMCACVCARASVRVFPCEFVQARRACARVRFLRRLGSALEPHKRLPVGALALGGDALVLSLGGIAHVDTTRILMAYACECVYVCDICFSFCQRARVCVCMCVLRVGVEKGVKRESTYI